MEYCTGEGILHLTKDLDFKFMSMTFGCPPKVIRLSCGNRSVTYIENLIQQELKEILQFLSDIDDCYLEIQ